MLGSAACRVFDAAGWHVTALHRDERALAPCQTELVLDVVDSDQVSASVASAPFDLVIHCAGLANVDACEREPNLAQSINVIGTENLARNTDKRALFVYVSTDQVYGHATDRSEDNERLEPINVYGRTKLKGEQVVRSLRERWIVVRTNVFGSNVKPGRQGSAEWMYRTLLAGERLPLFDDYRFSPIVSFDLAKLILQLSGAIRSRLVNIGSPIPCSKFEFGHQIADQFGLDATLIDRSSIHDHPFFAPRTADLALDVSQAAALGLDLPDYRASIRTWDTWLGRRDRLDDR